VTVILCNLNTHLLRLAALLSLALVICLASATSPQSTDNTVQAKQHYQNAIAAIAKNDWQTAKNELLHTLRTFLV
jgi:Tfp pilus assembly protein PilF